MRRLSYEETCDALSLVYDDLVDEAGQADTVEQVIEDLRHDFTLEGLEPDLDALRTVVYLAAADYAKQ